MGFLLEERMLNFFQQAYTIVMITFMSSMEGSHVYIFNAENPNQEMTMDVFPETTVNHVREFIVHSFWLYDMEIAAIKFAGTHLSDDELLADVGVCSEGKISFFVRNKVILTGLITLHRDRGEFEEFFNISVALGDPNFFGAVISEIKQNLKTKADADALFEKWDKVIPTMFHITSMKRAYSPRSLFEPGFFVLDPNIESVQLNLVSDDIKKNRNNSLVSRCGFGAWVTFKHRVIADDTILEDITRIANPCNIWYPRPLHQNRLNMLSSLLEPYYRVSIIMHEDLTLYFESKYDGPFKNLFERTHHLVF